MKDYIMDFMKKFEYPEEAEKSLLYAYSCIDKDDFSEILNIYKKNKNCDFTRLLGKISELSRRSGISVFQGHQILLICMSEHLKNLYKQKGYTDEMWKCSMYDLKYKLIECYKVKGIWGNFVADWETGFFDLTRFAFGRLQFELDQFEKEIFTKNGITIRKGDPVINVHIPRTQTPLDRQSCRVSYEEALNFFKPVFKGFPEVFVIYSWLLYPGYRKLLSEKSNIYRFATDYSVLYVTENENPSDNMWRLFDMEWTGDINDYPGDTSFRRNMKQYLKEGGKLGSAYAVYIP